MDSFLHLSVCLHVFLKKTLVIGFRTHSKSNDFILVTSVKMLFMNDLTFWASRNLQQGRLFNPPIQTVLTETATAQDQMESKNSYLETEPTLAKVKNSIKYSINQGSHRETELSWVKWNEEFFTGIWDLCNCGSSWRIKIWKHLRSASKQFS